MTCHETIDMADVEDVTRVAEESVPETAQTTTKSPTILVAEDDREMRGLLTWALTEEGYDVVEAENGIELLKRIEPSLLEFPFREEPCGYDLIISDVRMPGLSGLDVLAGVRLCDHETPFIVITAFGDEETHARAARLGSCLVLDKPFDMDDLLAIVRNIVPPS